MGLVVEGILGKDSSGACLVDDPGYPLPLKVRKIFKAKDLSPDFGAGLLLTVWSPISILGI